MTITKGKDVTTIVPGGRQVSKGAGAGHIDPEKAVIDTEFVFINEVPSVGGSCHGAILKVDLELLGCRLRDSKAGTIGDRMSGADPSIHGIAADPGNTAHLAGVGRTMVNALAFTVRPK